MLEVGSLTRVVEGRTGGVEIFGSLGHPFLYILQVYGVGLGLLLADHPRHCRHLSLYQILPLLPDPQFLAHQPRNGAEVGLVDLRFDLSWVLVGYAWFE